MLRRRLVFQDSFVRPLYDHMRVELAEWGRTYLAHWYDQTTFNCKPKVLNQFVHPLHRISQNHPSLDFLVHSSKAVLARWVTTDSRVDNQRLFKWPHWIYRALACKLGDISIFQVLGILLTQYEFVTLHICVLATLKPTIATTTTEGIPPTDAGQLYLIYYWFWRHLLIMIECLLLNYSSWQNEKLQYVHFLLNRQRCNLLFVI